MDRQVRLAEVPTTVDPLLAGAFLSLRVVPSGFWMHLIDSRGVGNFLDQRGDLKQGGLYKQIGLSDPLASGLLLHFSWSHSFGSFCFLSCIGKGSCRQHTQEQPLFEQDLQAVQDSAFLGKATLL